MGSASTRHGSIPRRAGSRGARCVVVALLLAFVLALVACGSSTEGAPSARAIEARLMAPCCWVGTLEEHESPLASSLRAEIARRFAAGEPSTLIEDDLALRYGERVRAVPKGGDPRGGLILGVGLATLAALGAALAIVWRWSRAARAVPAAPAMATPAARDAYDDRIDDELARLDG